MRSRADSVSAWHFTQANFDDIRTYFDGLEWSPDAKVSFLELFVDWYAFTGGALSNPRAGRLKPLSRLKSRSPRTLQGRCPVSHLTPFNRLKQALGLDMRPRSRCPKTVHELLVWSWRLPNKRASWWCKLPLTSQNSTLKPPSGEG